MLSTRQMPQTKNSPCRGNLDPNSAYYDPKTRAMRDNPYKSTGKTPEELNYAGDNFVRYTGDTSKHSQTQSFAWQMYEKA
ncbi:hypothetical protein JTE90_019440 [Oedothorax gibbosus]|uniref:Pre-mRNA-splicing factor SLU7 n=1 Tax=Oedothorax gibbosus TaxID=931172 RepID=A0AAV6TKI9_9ARAC|nr:hypothetical protein JTE90_019440 [Oedothorax gibbosus]